MKSARFFLNPRVEVVGKASDSASSVKNCSSGYARPLDPHG